MTNEEYLRQQFLAANPSPGAGYNLFTETGGSMDDPTYNFRWSQASSPEAERNAKLLAAWNSASGTVQDKLQAALNAGQMIGGGKESGVRELGAWAVQNGLATPEQIMSTGQWIAADQALAAREPFAGFYGLGKDIGHIASLGLVDKEDTPAGILEKNDVSPVALIAALMGASAMYGGAGATAGTAGTTTELAASSAGMGAPIAGSGAAGATGGAAGGTLGGTAALGGAALGAASSLPAGTGATTAPTTTTPATTTAPSTTAAPTSSGGVLGDTAAMSGGTGAATATGIEGLLSNPQVLGALGGAALSGMSGGSKQAGTVTVNEGLPDWLIPYAKPALDRYSTEVMNHQTDPYGIMPSAMQEFLKTIQGQYLDPSTNKWLPEYFKLGAERVKGALSPSFGHMQAFGQHSGYNEALSRGLGDLAVGLYGGAYEKERDRQNQMISTAPGFLTQNTMSQFAPYGAYLSSLSGLGSKKEQPYFDDPWGRILGGAMVGSQFGKAFS